MVCRVDSAPRTLFTLLPAVVDGRSVFGSNYVAAPNLARLPLDGVCGVADDRVHNQRPKRLR